MSDTLRQPTPPPPAPYIGRFAPTPSGELHLGSLVAALGSYLDAKAHGGLWRLRLDDLDAARCKPATAWRIVQQLADHGLAPDGAVIWQSTRTAHYQAAYDHLNAAAEVYRCQCTRNTLRAALNAGRVLDGVAGPIYPGTCLTHPPAPAQAAGGRWRVPSEAITLNDRFLGVISQVLPHTLGDPLLRRSDGVFAYHLAEVVDNQAYRITDVVRGADLAPLTPVQIALHQALFPDSPPPRYGHLPLVLGADGRKLSKTNHAAPLTARTARQNLIAAASVLDLKTPVSNTPIETLLKAWTTQWAHSRLSPELK
ncbi:MAG: tRNA glutamyl-Q(34) synthetase GluQRS [Halothiobacillus sp. 20-53-49]|nr:MAG: tRNA glutamyl-Q(34) synthetase GluQRS [Halothiobacillus sp. 20-53-49]HUN00369.1 tRNA glutamyl-Q(34) synthetase GluQRS [Halothiobacillus sp.]